MRDGKGADEGLEMDKQSDREGGGLWMSPSSPYICSKDLCFSSTRLAFPTAVPFIARNGEGESATALCVLLMIWDLCLLRS